MTQIQKFNSASMATVVEFPSGLILDGASVSRELGTLGIGDLIGKTGFGNRPVTIEIHIHNNYATVPVPEPKKEKEPKKPKVKWMKHTMFWGKLSGYCSKLLNVVFNILV